MKPRLLVIELHHLGDAVMSLPFVRAAQDRYEVHVLCRPTVQAVYGLLGEEPVIHAWDPPWVEDQRCGAWQAVASARDEGRGLRPLGFAAAVCVWADARAEIIMAETHATQRVGFPMTRGNYYAADLPWRRKRRLFGRALESFWQAAHPGRPLLTQWIHRETPRQSHLRCWEQIATALGVSCDYSVPWIQAPATNASGRDRPVLVVHAHARVPSKQWPRTRWSELLNSPSISESFDLREILPPNIEPVTSDKTRKLHTPDLASLVAALQGADAVLCHDSLPAHLAAALGKPVITIFGSGEPDWFAPWNNRDRVVQQRVCPLHPCIDRCGMGSYLCLQAVGVKDVLAKIESLHLAA